MPITLEKLIERHARYRGDQLAVVFGEQRLTWAHFSASVNQLANAMQARGIGKDDKIATALPNSMELLLIYWATVSIGAVLVPLSPLLKAKGLINLLNNADVCLAFLTPGLLAELEPDRDQIGNIKAENYILVSADESETNSYAAFVAGRSSEPPDYPEIQQEDLFNIVYSSGTTGMPKGIMHSHLVRANYGSHFAASFRMTPESVVLHTGSIVFNGAFVTLMPCFFLGARFILHPHFDVEAMIETVAREKVTHIMMVPSQIIALLQSPNFDASNMQSMEMLLTIGAPLQQQYKEAINAVIPGRFYELYGLTEGFVTILDRNDFDQQPGSVGCPPPGYEIRIVDDDGTDLPPGEIGEIVGRGPALSSGYYKQPELTRETFRNGWLYSGDLGYLDERGFLYLAGRKKELIITGGVNGYPQDIEEIAGAHEQVLETAVFGVDSDKWGETPVAAIVLHPEATLDAEELKQWINQRVEARFQKVSDVYLVDQMPRNVAGKTLKNELRENYLANQK
ncbi:MAG: class I adenylate-forming enzyme family protein [Gammaproteobacteria bacterium]